MTQVINWPGDSEDGVYISGGDPKETNHTLLRTMTFKLQQRTIKENPKTDKTFARSLEDFDPSVFNQVPADIIDSSKTSSADESGEEAPHINLEEEDETGDLLGLHDEQFFRDQDVEDLPVNQDPEELIGGGNFILSTSSTLLNAAGLTQEGFDGSVEEVDNLNNKRLMLNPSSRSVLTSTQERFDGLFNSNPADDLLNRTGSNSFSSDPMERLLQRVGQASYLNEDEIRGSINYWTPRVNSAVNTAREIRDNWANGAYDNELNLAKDVALTALEVIAATPQGRVAVAVTNGIIALAKYAAAEYVSATTPEGEVNEVAATGNGLLSIYEGIKALEKGNKISASVSAFDALLEMIKAAGDKDKGDKKIDPNRKTEESTDPPEDAKDGQPHAGLTLEEDIDPAIVEAFRQYLNGLTGKPDAPKDPDDLISNWGPDGKPMDIGHEVESIISYTNRLDPIINWGPNGKPQLVSEEEMRAWKESRQREAMNGDPTIINPGTQYDSFASNTGGDSTLSQQNNDSDSGSLTTGNSENDSAKIV